MSVFSERLVLLRKEKGVSQTFAAKELNISPRAYQKYEYEEAEPKLSIAVRIADFYGVSIDYLAGRTDTP
jgi:transcriptional regulator with XRE-family HTH domain